MLQTHKGRKVGKELGVTCCFCEGKGYSNDGNQRGVLLSAHQRFSRTVSTTRSLLSSSGAHLDRQRSPLLKKFFFMLSGVPRSVRVTKSRTSALLFGQAKLSTFNVVGEESWQR